jgi:hypothetical protein
MFLARLYNLEWLLQADTTRLIVALVACEAVLLLTPSSLLSALAFLGQRLALSILLWSTDRWPLSIAIILASFGVVMIQIVTRIVEWRQRGERAGSTEGFEWLPAELPWRLSATALGMLVAHGLVQTYLSIALPETAAIAVGFLATGGVLALIVAGSALQASLGLLMLADAYRVVYVLGQPDPLLWGMWLTTDLILVLGGSGLQLLYARRRAKAGQGAQAVV